MELAPDNNDALEVVDAGAVAAVAVDTVDADEPLLDERLVDGAVLVVVLPGATKLELALISTLRLIDGPAPLSASLTDN